MAQTKPTRMRLRQGDTVRVISGKDRGAEGEILKVDRLRNRVIVKGANLMKKTRRPTQDNPQGGFDEHEASIHASNVQLLDADGNLTRIGVQLEDGKKVRVARSNGAKLDEEGNRA